MRYLPHTEAEIAAMLDAIGVESVAELFAPIPAELQADPLDLEPALSEPELMKHLEELSARSPAANQLSFLGAGMYDHHVPPAVDQLLLRGEFYTAYTPYQAEVSQGTLQAIFEFQTTVCELFGTEVANASMYCAGSATAEAVLMARRVTRRKTVLVSAALAPSTRQIIDTYLSGMDGRDRSKGDESAKVVEIPVDAAGRTDLDALAQAIAACEEDGKSKLAAVVVAYPNFYGVVEDLRPMAEMAHAAGALLVSATSEPFALGVLEAPAKLGADVCVGEGQALAVPPQYGGPGVGLFGCRQKHVRQMPGRLVGETVDESGAPGFVLTLSTREQHIRRERATSNICTNHGLIALAMSIRTAMLGKRGFVETSQRCLANAEYLKAEIAKVPKLSLRFPDSPTFNEFVVDYEGDASALLDRVAEQEVLAGVNLGPKTGMESSFLVAVTEKHRKADLDHLVASLIAAV